MCEPAFTRSVCCGRRTPDPTGALGEVFGRLTAYDLKQEGEDFRHQVAVAVDAAQHPRPPAKPITLRSGPTWPLMSSGAGCRCRLPTSDSPASTR